MGEKRLYIVFVFPKKIPQRKIGNSNQKEGSRVTNRKFSLEEKPRVIAKYQIEKQKERYCSKQDPACFAREYSVEKIYDNEYVQYCT